MAAQAIRLAEVVFPPEDLTALLDLGRFLEMHAEPALLLGPDGEQVPLPDEVHEVLVKVVGAMREGKVITVVPRTQRLTTQEAADFLGVSRPTLVKLLEQGKIPYQQPGRHRRILFADLLAYADRQCEQRPGGTKPASVNAPIYMALRSRRPQFGIRSARPYPPGWRAQAAAGRFPLAT